MAQLDERTRGDLARLRALAAPSEATKQRMFAALEAQLGDPDDGEDGEGGDDGSGDLGEFGDLAAARPGQLGYAAKVVGATLGLTGAGLLAVAIGARLVAALAGDPVAPPTASQSPTSTQDVEVAAAPAPVDDEAVAIDPPADDESAPIVEAAPVHRRPSTSKPSSSPADTLAEELALLEAAHAAKDPTIALSALERHLARFPRGSMAAERERLRVEVLCRLDRLDEARELADRLLREHKNAASRASLSAACPELAARKN